MSEREAYVLKKLKEFKDEFGEEYVNQLKPLLINRFRREFDNWEKERLLREQENQGYLDYVSEQEARKQLSKAERQCEIAESRAKALDQMEQDFSAIVRAKEKKKPRRFFRK